MPHKGRKRDYPSTPGHPNPARTGLADGFGRARAMKVGVEPGAGEERKPLIPKPPSLPTVGRAVGRGVKKVFTGLVPSEPESLSKARGVRAYEEGKLDLALKRKGYKSPSTIRSR